MSRQDTTHLLVFYKCMYWCINYRLNQNNEQIIHLYLFIKDINIQYKYFYVQLLISEIKLSRK